MKDKIVLKDGWVWPKNDEMAWKWQNEFSHLVDKIVPFLKGNECMIQAGGNCGFILKTFVPHFKKIYTFEPDAVNFYCLVNNVESDNVIKMQACLGNKREQVSTSHLIRENKPNDVGGVFINGIGNIPTIIIDDLNLPNCDLIQLDVEGYELFALYGAEKTIQKYRPVLCVELCEKWLERYGKTAQEIYDYLNRLNYKQIDSYGVDKIFISN